MSPGDKITSLSHLSPLRTTVSSLNFSPKLQICIFSCLLDTSVWMSNYPYLTWSRPGFWYIFLNTILPQTLHLSSLRIHPSSCLGQKPWCFLDSPLSLTPTSWFIRKSLDPFLQNMSRSWNPLTTAVLVQDTTISHLDCYNCLTLDSTVLSLHRSLQGLPVLLRSKNQNPYSKLPGLMWSHLHAPPVPHPLP